MVNTGRLHVVSLFLALKSKLVYFDEFRIDPMAQEKGKTFIPLVNKILLEMLAQSRCLSRE